jgi:hypothetical protein
VVRRALAVVPVTVALVRLRLSPARLVFVGCSAGQRWLFLVVAMCAARVAPWSSHYAIVAIVLGWRFRCSAFADRPRGDKAMVDQERITEGTEQPAGKAAKLGGQAIDRATTIAGQLAQKAGPVAGQAKDKTVEMAQKAAPVAGQARDKAVDMAHKAAPVAGQARDKAIDMAHKAGPVAAQARDKAVEIAHKAGPVAAQARDKAVEIAHKAGPVAAHGVETTARKLDELTHGKYSDQLKSISTRVEQMLAQNGRSAPSGDVSQD